MRMLAWNTKFHKLLSWLFANIREFSSAELWLSVSLSVNIMQADKYKVKWRPYQPFCALLDFLLAALMQ